jgi:hypothetical protein
VASLPIRSLDRFWLSANSRSRQATELRDSLPSVTVRRISRLTLTETSITGASLNGLGYWSVITRLKGGVFLDVSLDVGKSNR